MLPWQQTCRLFETLPLPEEMQQLEKDTAEKPVARLDFARRLRELRVVNGYKTARSLARAIGIDENRYTRYERAEVEPDLTLIRLLVAALRTTPNHLLGNATSPMPGFSDHAEGNHAYLSASVEPLIAPRASRAAALSWALAEAVVDARGDRAADSPETRLANLQVVSDIYQQLGRDPFGTIAMLVRQPAVTETDPATLQRIQDIIANLTRELADHDRAGN